MGGDESGSVCTTLRTFGTAEFQPYSNSAGALRVPTLAHQLFPEESRWLLMKAGMIRQIPG